MQDMLHDYNTPFQLAKIEEDDEEEEVDSPDDAELYAIEVRRGRFCSVQRLP
jgi:hypothetical protein